MNTRKIKINYLKYVKDPIILAPKSNHLYKILDGKNTIKITFEGDQVYKILYFKPSTGIISINDGNDFKTIYIEWNITKDSLPPIFQNLTLPKIMIFQNQQAKSLLQMKIFVDKGSFKIHDISLKPFIFPYELKTHNIEIQNHFQKLIKNISVKTGDYPIFLDKNKPSIDSVKNLYGQFIDYNTDKKLLEQYTNTESQCYVRAHFISTFLREKYGIQTVKVFKRWKIDEWKKFYKNKAWIFHCATMLFTNENQGLIWDPWVGFNKKLLTFQEWIIRNDEPTPYKVMITNCAIGADFEMGATISSTSQLRSYEEYNNAFQAVASSVPNHPVKTVSYSGNRCGFFKFREINTKKDLILSISQTYLKIKH